jgi:hypothetical protein
MKRVAALLASPRLTLAGFAVLALAILAALQLPQLPAAAIALPLALLGVNLVAAIALRPVLRRGGLGVFHFALLGVLLLAGWGRLTHFDGRVEVVDDGAYDASLVEVTGRGPWHGEDWKGLQFRQSGWEVDYAPRVKRTRTRSTVWLPEETTPQVVGDDTPLLIQGYRLYTTPNKGFAPLLTWEQPGAAPVQGALHMPTYPLFDWKQENSWTAPDGTKLRFWLRIERALPEDSAWTLRPADVPATLVVEAAGARHELKPGGALALPQGTLRYERLTGWMGYRIFYDPTLMPLLVVSLLGVAGLGWHLWRRVGRLAPGLQEAAA